MFTCFMPGKKSLHANRFAHWNAHLLLNMEKMFSLGTFHRWDGSNYYRSEIVTSKIRSGGPFNFGQISKTTVRNPVCPDFSFPNFPWNERQKCYLAFTSPDINLLLKLNNRKKMHWVWWISKPIFLSTQSRRHTPFSVSVSVTDFNHLHLDLDLENIVLEFSICNLENFNIHASLKFHFSFLSIAIQSYALCKVSVCFKRMKSRRCGWIFCPVISKQLDFVVVKYHISHLEPTSRFDSYHNPAICCSV